MPCVCTISCLGLLQEETPKEEDDEEKIEEVKEEDETKEKKKKKVTRKPVSSFSKCACVGPQRFRAILQCSSEHLP